MGILQLGFKNTFKGNQATGFQVPVLNEYYRGTRVSLTEGFDVTVDGETFPREQVTCTFGTTTLTQDQLDSNSDLIWQYLEPVILNVSKPGGLAPGLHEVKVSFGQRISYMPPALNLEAGTRTYTAKLAVAI